MEDDGCGKLNAEETPDRNQKNTASKDVKARVLEHIRLVQLESATAVIEAFQVLLSHSDFQSIIESFETAAEIECSKGEIRSANRMGRRKRALKVFRDHGLDPARLIAPARLPDGHNGKILMMAISGGALHGRVCLRSGDDWHREILTDTQEEIQDLGFDKAAVDPVGGAHVKFKGGGHIEIYGISDEFGGCDKHAAADLIRIIFPERKIIIGN